MYPGIEVKKTISPDDSVICVVSGKKLPDWLKLTKAENDYARNSLEKGDDIVLINSYSRINIIVVNSTHKIPGKQSEELRRSGAKISGMLSAHKTEKVFIASEPEKAETVLALAEGLVLANYRFNRHKTGLKEEEKKLFPARIFFHNYISGKDLSWFKAVTRAVYFARDMVNEPNNLLNAGDFADIIRKNAGKAGVQVEVYGKKKIEALRMGGILSVNRGSKDPPSFSILEWKPENAVNKKPVILIGKAVMFDTGGINLKPGAYIDDMKSDMAGGAVVASVITALAETGLKVHVMGLIPATDNRPGYDAIVPGDIITMFNGKQVEVINTDAEGRLILADALSFADNYKPSLVLSIATLTGSAENAFGNQAIATMGNADRRIFDILSESGNDVYERTAEMPFFEEYGEMMKSEIADLKNLGDKKAGAITAGKFLEYFTKSPYIHLDIAGCSLSAKKEHYRPAGGTGTGVRLLTAFIRNLESGKVKL